ncbi:MAG: Mth938-like domain-containing protein [Rhodocyclaceae bacterium]
MKLQLSNPDSGYTFTAYGDDYIAVNGKRYNTNVALLPGQMLAEWTSASFEMLTEADFAKLAALAPEILLLGTGKTLRFPTPELLQPLMAARIGFEVMDTHAACRTYNILAAEGRKVAAAILI